MAIRQEQLTAPMKTKVSVLVISQEGFADISGGAILKSNLFLHTRSFEVMSMDCGGVISLRKIGFTHFPLTEHVLGIQHRNSSPDSARKSVKTRSRFLQSLVELFVGNATRPSILLGYRKILANARNFDPDIIYTNFGSPGLNRLVVLLTRDLSAKLIVHFMDDWHRGRNSYGFLSRILRPVLDRQIQKLLHAAAVRYVISDGMKREYEARFKLHFDVLHNGINLARLPNYKASRELDSYIVRYVGTLLQKVHDRAIFSIINAIKNINHGSKLSKPLKLEISCSNDAHFFQGIGDKYIDFLSVSAAPIADDAFHESLQSASLLILPMPFELSESMYTKYSFSAKLPSYLASGTPIVACGHSENYQLSFLRSVPGVYVVTENDSELGLEGAILAGLKADRGEFANYRASKVREHFDLGRIRADFESKLLGLV